MYNTSRSVAMVEGGFGKVPPDRGGMVKSMEELKWRLAEMGRRRRWSMGKK